MNTKRIEQLRFDLANEMYYSSADESNMRTELNKLENDNGERDITINDVKNNFDNDVKEQEPGNNNNNDNGNNNNNLYIRHERIRKKVLVEQIQSVLMLIDEEIKKEIENLTEQELTQILCKLFAVLN